MFGKKAKAEAKKKAEMNEALREFYSFIKVTLEGKRDDQVDWLMLNKEGFTRWYNLVKEFPEAADLLDWHPEVEPECKVYSFIDDEGCWRNWSFSTMQEHQRYFETKKVWELYKKGNRYLTLEEIGPLGESPDDGPYEGVAYLSFAYYTKSLYKRKIKELEQLLN